MMMGEFRDYISQLEKLKDEMIRCSKVIYMSCYLEQMKDITKEDWKEITETCEKFTNSLFDEVNFPLHKVTFHTNWNYRLFEAKKEAIDRKPVRAKDVIENLMSQLNPEERAALAKKLGG